MPLVDSDHNKKKNILLVLKPIEGQHTKSSTGLIDNRLFSGENKLHAVMDDATCLWSMNYDKGLPPQEFRQRFTSFPKLLKYAKEYFKRRNIDIIEVID